MHVRTEAVARSPAASLFTAHSWKGEAQTADNQNKDDAKEILFDDPDLIDYSRSSEFASTADCLTVVFSLQRVVESSKKTKSMDIADLNQVSSSCHSGGDLLFHLRPPHSPSHSYPHHFVTLPPPKPEPALLINPKSNSDPNLGTEIGDQLSVMKKGKEIASKAAMEVPKAEPYQTLFITITSWTDTAVSDEIGALGMFLDIIGHCVCFLTIQRSPENREWIHLPLEAKENEKLSLEMVVLIGEDPRMAEKQLLLFEI
ncbi:hypothetical protein HAX54_010726 [Datura stramonium]|uniref:Uncharacterized protein n=1 Tax=Datura stramonium TaxID=4076 RepID=A0ABS8TIM4_DATST|nr:hypothetical protein [Datura stramonium]